MYKGACPCHVTPQYCLHTTEMSVGDQTTLLVVVLPFCDTYYFFQYHVHTLLLLIRNCNGVTLGYPSAYPYLYPSKTHTRTKGMGFQRVTAVKYIINSIYIKKSKYPQKWACRLVFEGGGGGGVGEEQPPSKMSHVGSFLRVLVMVVLARSICSRKQAYMLVFCGAHVESELVHVESTLVCMKSALVHIESKLVHRVWASLDEIYIYISDISLSIKIFYFFYYTDLLYKGNYQKWMIPKMEEVTITEM
jgi:hypothetical protein